MQWRTRAGDEVAARLGEPLTKDLTAQALRTALDPAGSWIPSVLAAADSRLSEVRRHVPDAGGLVIATDQDSARAYAKLLRQITGEPPTVVLSDEKAASKKIADVHRQRRPLDGRGADGVRGRRRAAARGRRLRHHDLDAAVLRPGRRPLRPGPGARRDRLGVPAVGADAARLRLGDGGRARPRARAARSPTRATSSPPSRTCSTRPTPARPPPTSSRCPSRRSAREARFDRVLYDGGEFGHAGEVHVGSEEEMDFLGIPGLLEPDQVRDLLHQRQTDRATKQKAGRRPGRTPSPRCRPTSSWRSCAASSTGWSPPGTTAPARPHGITHAALRKECGGPAAAVATADQLHARIDRLREWAARKTS